MSDKKFSIGLRLSDLNDFIAPSQACTKPADVNKTGGDSAIEVAADGTAIEVAADGSRSELRAASVTLNDCLACSGCITSAEGVLVAAQSAKEFLTRMAQAKQAGTVAVVSVSQHSLASLAAFYDLSLVATFKRLVTLFKTLGAKYIIDTSFTADVSLEETATEFVDRLRKVDGAGPLPMLASECPGWVCYAEKTQAHALPYMCSSKSAMEVAGALVRTLAPGVQKKDLFHAALMPCFDKKLEASRDDFDKDVDTVLATNEVPEVLESLGVSFTDLAESPLDDGSVPFANFDPATGVLFGAPHAAAGGYLESALRRAASDVHGIADAGALSFAPAASAAKNADFCEAVAPGVPAGNLRCAFAYGFRNIQNVMRKLKSKSCAYHFVEVMACPMACLNGGGQMKPPKDVARDVWLERVRSRFAERVERDPRVNTAAAKVREQLGRKGLRTQYHVREDKSAKNPLAIQW